MKYTSRQLIHMIDHTILTPSAALADVKRYCREAIDYGYCSVITQNYWVPVVANELRGSQVLVGSVVGFPMGCNTTESKRFECRQNIEHGAQEVDTVIGLPSLKNGLWDEVLDDITALADICHSAASRVNLKVIIETCLLTDDEKKRAAEICSLAGADFVKTSTGLAGPGATVHDVQLLRRYASPSVQIKAAGGIRTSEHMMAMVEAGATRIGTSAANEIRQQLLGDDGE